MEAWRDELYHGLLANLRSRVKNVTGTSGDIGRKGKGLGGGPVGTGKGREWSNHKYIKKEGNRYIYPEDLKKNSKKNRPPTVDMPKATKEERKLMRGTTFGRINKTYKNHSKSGLGANITAGKLEREIKRAHKKNQITTPGSNVDRRADSVKGSIYKDRNVYTLEQTAQFRNGKTWFDTVDVKTYYNTQDLGGYGGVDKAYTMRNEYTVSYGKIHQAYNEGRDWVKKHIG